MTLPRVPVGRLYGAPRSIVRKAIDVGEPLPGTTGFAGELDGRLVRDVLGRVPLYVERSVVSGADDSVDSGANESLTPGAGESLDSESTEPVTSVARESFDSGPTEPVTSGARDPEDPAWAFSPKDLADPTLVPPGSVGPPGAPKRVWQLPEPDPDHDHTRSLDRLDAAVRSSTAIVDSEGLAVAFSGGLDSALLAALVDAPLYVVGFPDGADVEAAREAADVMGRTDDLRVRELDLERLERAVPTVASAIGRTNAMDVGIGLSLYLVAEAAAADGYDRLLLGQGADELFGGYEKVVRLDHRVAAETVRGAVREQIETLPDQLPRDVLTIRAAGLTPVAPLLHDAVVEPALSLPVDWLATETERKRALRAVATRYLPESVAMREKKAVQYGSLVARELDRLARQAGYKRRMDDHVSRYISSLLEADADHPTH